MRQLKLKRHLTSEQDLALREPENLDAEALVLPIAFFRNNVRNTQAGQIFGLLVADLRGNAQAERCTVFACKWLVVHLVAEQRLRVESGSHVEGFVVIVGTLDIEKLCVSIRADVLEEVGDTRSAKSPNRIPAFDTNMSRILRQFWQRLDLRQSVFAGPFNITADA